MVETANGGDDPTAGPFDAVVLAGGAGRRLGGADKPWVVVAGLPLVDHVLEAVRSARCVVLVARPELARAGVLMTLEDPPGGGPVAGLAAGLAVLDHEAPADDGLVVVLACDVPAAGRALPTLLAAVVPGATALGSSTRPAVRSTWSRSTVARRCARRSRASTTCAVRRCAPARRVVARGRPRHGRVRGGRGHVGGRGTSGTSPPATSTRRPAGPAPDLAGCPGPPFTRTAQPGHRRPLSEGCDEGHMAVVPPWPERPIRARVNQDVGPTCPGHVPVASPQSC